MKINSLLIIEDDTYILDIYSDVLKESGIKVAEVLNGKDALTLLLSKEHFDVILLDIMVPQLDGLGLLQKIHKNPKLHQSKIILFTNLNDENLLNKCYKLGAIGAITKSDISPDRLLPKIQEIISQNESKT